MNVVIVYGGELISIPVSWRDDFEFFQHEFGEAFPQSLLTKTWKVTGGDAPTYVWQDYVAGTDTTNPESIFTADITIEDGKPVVKWDPDLNEGRGRTGERIYTLLGSTNLVEWTEVPENGESNFNFFKVKVTLPQ